jgi:hypothetical protein
MRKLKVASSGKHVHAWNKKNFNRAAAIPDSSGAVHETLSGMSLS